MGSTLSNLIYHVIFSTKNRESIIRDNFSGEIYRYIGGIVKQEGGILLGVDGMTDHIHMIIKLRPVHSLSVIMQKVKGGSSKWINKEKRLNNKFAWQDGYGAFSVSESQVSAVIQYLRDQKKHHAKYSFQDEFLQFLKRHHIEYDERYIWK